MVLIKKMKNGSYKKMVLTKKLVLIKKIKNGSYKKIFVKCQLGIKVLCIAVLILKQYIPDH